MRGSINGKDMSWTKQENELLGIGQLKIPNGAIIHCVASYNGFAQHQGWISDPKNFTNPRRALMEETDDGLEVLKDFLFEEKSERKTSADFEFGIAWLLWMLGFSLAHIGATKKTSDAVDIIAIASSGNTLVVECTTSLLKSDKLAKLVERSVSMKKRLDNSGHGHSQILPVAVTSKTREEVSADLDHAKKLGISVVTKEDLVAALTETIIPVDSNVVFQRLWQSVHQSELQTLLNR